MSDIPAGVKVESVFLVEAQYTPEAAEKRPPGIEKAQRVFRELRRRQAIAHLL